MALSACKTDQERAEEAYQRGMALVAAGDLARAQVEFRNATAADMNHVGAQIEIGRLNFRQGNERAAFRAYGRVYEVDPDNLEAAAFMARIAFVRQEWDIFDRYAGRALELAPEDPGVKVIDLARQYRQSVLDRNDDRRKELVARAETLSVDARDDMMLRFVLIDGYAHQGRFDKALEQANAAIALDPTNQRLHPLKLQLLAQTNDAEGIKTELRRMIQAFPKDKAYKGSLLRFLIARGEIDEAESFLRAEAKAAETAGKNEDRLAPVVDLVQFLRARRSPEVALTELDTRLKTSPDAYRLRALRAALSYETGKRSEAISEMETLSELDDKAITTEERQNFKVVLAGMLNETGNEVGSRRLIEDVLETDPNNVEALKIRANWLIEEDKTAEAVNALRTALAGSPDDTVALTLMARAYERGGNKQLMLESLSLAVESSKNAPEESLRYAQALVREKRLDQAASVLESALRLVPRDVALLSNLGQVYLEQDNRPLVRRVIDQLGAVDSEPARLAVNELELRLIEREQGTDQALGYLESLATNNEDDRVKLALIRAQLLSGKTAEALDYVNQLVAAQPDNFSYRFFQSLTLAAAQQYAEAEKGMTALVAEKPQLPQPWLQLARLRGVTGSQDAMMATLDEALKSLPDSPDILWAKASMLERLGRIDETLAIYEKLYERDSSSMLIANNLASMLATYRSDPESLARAETIARRLNGSDVPAMQETYGWILFRNGKAQEALTYLEPAAKGLTADPTAQVHLGLVYNALGRKDEARAQLDLARRLAGDTPSATVTQNITALEGALAQ